MNYEVDMLIMKQTQDNIDSWLDETNRGQQTRLVVINSVILTGDSRPG